jgi:hypothetical protein
MEEIFNVEENLQVYMTTRDIVQRLVMRTLVLARKNNSNKIITNGNMASVLSDSSAFANSMSRLYPDARPYQLGVLYGTSIFVDPYMRWSDNRILFYNSSEKNEPIRSYSDMDPYGEEDWNDNFKEDELIFTLKIEDEKAILI